MKRIIRVKELAQIMGVSRSTIYRMRQEGFIPFIQIGPRSVGVLESDLDIWLGERELATQGKNPTHTNSNTSEQLEQKTQILGE